MAHVSKYRFIKPIEARPDQHFLNVSPSEAIWDCANFMACSSKFIAVPWKQLGGILVTPHDKPCKFGSPPPLLHGQSGHVIDLAFSPFNPSLLVSSSEDSTIRGWSIPEGGVNVKNDSSIFTLEGHSKKCGIMNFHPSADQILASASVDGSVKLWDLEQAKSIYSFAPHNLEQIMSLNFNLDGSLLNSTTKDKKINVMDSRTGKVEASTYSHEGNKTQRSVWAKRLNFLISVGFSSSQARQIKIWDPRKLNSALHTEDVDNQSSVLMPFYDEDLSILYLAGKGDGSIRFYDFQKEGRTTYCSMYNSSEPLKGLSMLPKVALDLHHSEIARFYKLCTKSIYSISMTMPRRNTDFEEEIYPPTFSDKPAITNKDFIEGKNSSPLTTSMRDIYNDKENNDYYLQSPKHKDPEYHSSETFDSKTEEKYTFQSIKAQEIIISSLELFLQKAKEQFQAMDEKRKEAEEKRRELEKLEEEKLRMENRAPWDGISIPNKFQILYQVEKIKELSAQYELASSNLSKEHQILLEMDSKRL